MCSSLLLFCGNWLRISEILFLNMIWTKCFCIMSTELDNYHICNFYDTFTAKFYYLKWTKIYIRIKYFIIIAKISFYCSENKTSKKVIFKTMPCYRQDPYETARKRKAKENKITNVFNVSDTHIFVGITTWLKSSKLLEMD